MKLWNLEVPEQAEGWQPQEGNPNGVWPTPPGDGIRLSYRLEITPYAARFEVWRDAQMIAHCEETSPGYESWVEYIAKEYPELGLVKE